MPVIYDFSVWRGNTGTIDNPAGLVLELESDGAPRDLTGTEIIFVARKPCSKPSDTPVMRKTSANGDIVIDMASDYTRVTVPFSVTDTRSLSMAVEYEIEFRGTGSERTEVKGTITPQGGINDDA